MTAKTFTFTVTAAPPPPTEGGPSWFQSLPYLQWVPLAAGSTRTDLASWQRGTRLDSTVSPPPYQGNNSQDDIIQTGNGAAVDQQNLEMLIIAPGGHSGRQENDSFRLVLNTSTPYWQRLTDSTPFADLSWHIDSNATTQPEQNQYWSLNQRVSPGNGVPASGGRVWNTPTGGTVDIRYYPACAGDGAVSSGSTSRQQWRPWTITSLNDIDDRPRTMHTGYTPWYSNGKVWFPLQNSVDVGTGFSLNVIMSFDVTTVRNGTIPRPFVPGRDVWDYYRPVSELSTTNNVFGSCAMDSSTGRVWYHANLTRFYAVNTITNPGTYTSYVDPNAANAQFTNAASAICPVAGRRLWVILATGSNHANTLRVYDLDLIEAGTVNATSCERLIEVPSIANKVWNFNHTDIGEEKKGWGMVWYEPDKSFLLYSCDDMSRNGSRSGYLRRLKPPLNANGTYNRGGTWTCDEIAVGGALPDFVTGPGTTSVSGGSLTRFNIFHNVGNGESMLVSMGNFDTPCYVCRLPNSTLTGV